MAYKIPAVNYGAPASGITNFGGANDQSNPFTALSAGSGAATGGGASAIATPDWSSVGSALSSHVIGGPLSSVGSDQSSTLKGIESWFSGLPSDQQATLSPFIGQASQQGITGVGGADAETGSFERALTELGGVTLPPSPIDTNIAAAQAYISGHPAGNDQLAKLLAMGGGSATAAADYWARLTPAQLSEQESEASWTPEQIASNAANVLSDAEQTAGAGNVSRYNNWLYDQAAGAATVNDTESTMERLARADYKNWAGQTYIGPTSFNYVPQAGNTGVIPSSNAGITPEGGIPSLWDPIYSQP